MNHGFQYVNLYRCTYGAYTIVVAAATPKHARVTFSKWLKDQHGGEVEYTQVRAKRAKTIGGSPLVVPS
jgi:hypothetical protein